MTDDALTPKKPEHFGVGFGNKANLIDIYNHGRIRVEQIYVHPLYNVSLTDTVHDIAIVKLSQPLSFDSESVGPACVLQENEGGRMRDYGEVISTGKLLSFCCSRLLFSGRMETSNLERTHCSLPF